MTKNKKIGVLVLPNFHFIVIFRPPLAAPLIFFVFFWDGRIYFKYFGILLLIIEKN